MIFRTSTQSSKRRAKAALLVGSGFLSLAVLGAIAPAASAAGPPASAHPIIDNRDPKCRGWGGLVIKDVSVKRGSVVNSFVPQNQMLNGNWSNGVTPPPRPNGTVKERDVVSVTFRGKPECVSSFKNDGSVKVWDKKLNGYFGSKKNHVVTFESWQAQDWWYNKTQIQKPFVPTVSAPYDATKDQTLTIPVADCYFQIDLWVGHAYWGEDLALHANDGTKQCDIFKPAVTTSTTQAPTTTTTTAAPATTTTTAAPVVIPTTTTTTQAPVVLGAVLAKTGSNTASYLAMGFTLLALGFALVLAARRRRTAGLGA